MLGLVCPRTGFDFTQDAAEKSLVLRRAEYEQCVHASLSVSQIESLR